MDTQSGKKMRYEKRASTFGENISEALLSYIRIDPTPLVVTKSNKILWINDALEDLLSIGLEDVYEQDISEVVRGALPTIKTRRAEGAGTAFHNTGREITVRIRETPVGNAISVVQITPMSFKKTESEITKYRERLWVLANQIKIGVFYTEVGARIQFANDAMAQIYENPVETLLGTGWIDQIPPNQREKVERAILQTLSGQSSSVEVQITTLTNQVKDIFFTLSPIISDDSRFGFAATAEDITERHQRTKEMEKAALYDSLTGLRNRVSLNHDYHELLYQMQSGAIGSITAIFCDLNHFKIINDTYGHNAGDRVLVSFATALSTTLGPYLIPYRYAGDEFVVIGTNLKEKELVETVLEIRKSTTLEISLENDIIKIDASFGHHTTYTTKKTLSDMIAEADAAMYKEKQNNRANKAGG